METGQSGTGAAPVTSGTDGSGYRRVNGLPDVPFSDSQVIRAPGLDGFLDVRAGEILFECPLDQLGNFSVRSKSQSDQLPDRQLRNARAQGLRQQLAQAQALFQANDA